MARTKKITLFYHLTTKEIIQPPDVEKQRKDDWIRGYQKTVEADYKPLIVKVTYEIFNPETDQIRKFFNGPVVEYYAIQSKDILDGDVDPEITEMTRETLLDTELGYDVQLIDKTIRKRKSTADFISTQQWNNFLETLREGQFDPQGYEFPDSELFWELEKVHGYKQAQAICVKQLRERIKRKLSTPDL